MKQHGNANLGEAMGGKKFPVMELQMLVEECKNISQILQHHNVQLARKRNIWNTIPGKACPTEKIEKMMAWPQEEHKGEGCI